jgi:hypothetical protein
MTEAATAALRLAATRRIPNGKLTTGRVLAALAQIDVANAWDRVWLHAGEPDALRLASAPDADEESVTERWENVPLSGDMANAMTALRLISQRYMLSPASTGVLALALVADPRSGAARTLCANGLSHAELIEIIQDDLIGVGLDGLSDVIAGLRGTPGPQRAPGSAELTVAELLRLAADRAAGRAPDELDILITMLAMPRPGELLERMGLDRELFEETEEPLRTIGVRGAMDVSPAEGGESAMHLLAGLAQAPSPGLSWLLRMVGIDRTDIAAEAMDAAATDAGRPQSLSGGAILLGIVNVLLCVVNTVLVIIHAIDPGSLWELLLIPLLWFGYPRWPSGVALIIAAPMFFLVSPAVGAVQLVTGIFDWFQARAERRALIARTGVVVSYGVHRRVSLRRLRKGRLSLLWRREIRIRRLRPRMLRAAESVALSGRVNASQR